jgi:hypothetical protein
MGKREDRLAYLAQLKDGWAGCTHGSPNVALGVKPSANVISAVRDMLKLMPNFSPFMCPMHHPGGIALEWDPFDDYMCYMYFSNDGSVDYHAYDFAHEDDKYEVQKDFVNPSAKELAEFLLNEKAMKRA